MTDLSSKTCLIVGHPMFLPLCEHLGKSFGKVYVWMPGHDSTFPEITEGMVGFGLPNVQRVESVFGPHFQDTDVFVFVDLYFADLQIELERQGKAVWGSRNGEELETYREVAKKLMEEVGYPVQPWKSIKGMEALREHLKAHENQFVKINRFRGNFETFFSPKYEVIEATLDKIAYNMGPMKELAEFLVEDELPDCVEIGIDTYCIDGAYPSHALVGIEVKDLGYIGEWKKWTEIPEPIRRWNEKMAPFLGEYGFRGFISNEIRICEDKTPYMIDATMRQPSPPGEAYQLFYENLAEVIWDGAHGKLREPKVKGRFVCEVILKSDWATEEPLRVEYPEKFADQIKLFNSVVIDGVRWVIPQGDSMPEFGAVVGYGETVEEAIEMVRKAGESIVAHKLKFEMGAADKALEQMETINEILPVFSLEQNKETV